MKTYAVTRDAIELDTVYQAIDKEELEQKNSAVLLRLLLLQKRKSKRRDVQNSDG